MTVRSAASRLVRRIAHAAASTLIALLMLSHALLAFSTAVSPSHDPLGAMTHAHDLAIPEAGQDGHGHSHEAFDNDGGMQQHGHDAADHSHDKPDLPPSRVSTIEAATPVWNAAGHAALPPDPCFSFERPPRTVPIA